MKAWYAIHTKAQKEEVAARDLRERGFEVLWPYVSEWVGAGLKDKTRLVKRSWLSRYLFVRTDHERLSDIMDDRAKNMGVSAVVRATNQEPHPIPEDAIQYIIDKTDPLGEVYRPGKRKPSFSGQVGDAVKGKEGWPIWGLIGEISRVCGDSVGIRMVMLGSEREVEVPVQSVEIIERAAS